MQLEARMFTEDELLDYLSDRCEAEGGIKPWAVKRNVSFSYVASVLRGDARPGPKILQAMQARKVSRYEMPVAGV